jgi:uncharacterized protein (TIGR02996 family)
MMTLWRPNTPIRAPLETSVVVHGAGPRVVPITERITTIGRRTDNTIAIADGTLSPHHARLVQTPAGLVIEDLASDNGTWVAFQQRVVKHALHVGDSVLVGRVRLTFEHTLAPRAVATAEAKLIAAICAEPDDDEPRLVLADYLTGRGDPRGEYIAYEIAAQSSINTEARARADALLAHHELDWLAPLTVPVASWEFRRGLLDCVWIREGIGPKPLFAHHPLRAVLAAS